MIDKTKMYKAKKKKAIKQLKSYRGKETSIEKKVREFLDQIGLYYEQEYAIKHTLKNRKTELYKVYDFMIEGVNAEGQRYKFLVECDGSYWHGQDYLEGKTTKLTKIQKSNIRNDKVKDKIAKEKGIPLVRLTETEIKWDFDSAIDKILSQLISLKS